MIKTMDLIIKAKSDIKKTKNEHELELIRIKYLGQKGFFTQKIKELKYIIAEKRPAKGMLIHKAIKDIKQIIIDHKIFLEKSKYNKQISSEILDITLPGRRNEGGGLHPISNTINRIENFFEKLGFSITYGLEVEDSYHNFDALNIPVSHVSRTNKDTFWFDNNRLLRTQTSNIQIRIMKLNKPPIYIISSGRVYRNDYDQTHTPMFHQMEGLAIDTNITFSNLKGTINSFIKYFFEKKIKIRFRPSYFPFTEPSAEIDIMYNNNRWLEILGCGMVHPNVLHNSNIDPMKYSGFAFGIGIERLTMLYYGIKDLRDFFKGDIRFLKQFK